MNDDIRYRLLKIIEARPDIRQRDLADALGISLGKTNYCLKALIDKGLIKARNFKNNNNKMAYAYLMTPAGIEEKARVTVNFLRRKVTEYESLQREIEELRREVRESGLPTEREL